MERTGDAERPMDWTDAVDAAVDIRNAIEEARECGSLDDWDCLVLCLHYGVGVSLTRIAEVLSAHEDVVRRAKARALKAIKDTGYLDDHLEEE